MFLSYFLDAIAMLSTGMVCLQTKLPFAEVAPIWQFTPEKKKRIVPPLKKVGEKWVPLWLLKYQDDVVLAGVLTEIVAQNVAATVALRDRKALETKEAGSAPSGKVNGSGQPSHAEPKPS
jgi:hypothetical protein